MAAPTTLAVRTDLEEYSKFESDYNRSVITITVTASGGTNMQGEQITVQLIKARRNRDVVIHTSTLTVTATTDPATVIGLIDLESVVDTSAIQLIRRGKYIIRVSSVTDTNVTADSAVFKISILTANFLRNSYLFGLKLDSYDIRDVKTQPTSITGIEIAEVSTDHRIGFDSMVYRNDSINGIRHLSWGPKGPIVPITGPGRYLLKYNCSDSYIVVQVSNVDNLPSDSVTEELYIGKAVISDNLLRRWINQACDWIENNKLSGVYLEPTRLVTDRLSVGGEELDWDFIVNPLTFYPSVPSQWVDILFPFMSLLKVEELFGQLANTRILNVDTTWIERSEKNGFVQLIPFNQTAAYQFIGLVWVESLRGKMELPNFWHYNVIAGLRQVDPGILEIIGKKAAIDALTVAGHAFRGGFSSQSISRDGVSESVSYTSSAIYGIYSATIEDFNKHINKEIKQLKGRYKGLNVIVL